MTSDYPVSLFVTLPQPNCISLAFAHSFISIKLIQPKIQISKHSSTLFPLATLRACQHIEDNRNKVVQSSSLEVSDPQISHKSRRKFLFTLQTGLFVVVMNTGISKLTAEPMNQTDNLIAQLHNSLNMPANGYPSLNSGLELVCMDNNADKWARSVFRLTQLQGWSNTYQDLVFLLSDKRAIAHAVVDTSRSTINNPFVVSVSVLFSFAPNSHKAWLSYVLTDPHYRRRGFARLTCTKNLQAIHSKSPAIKEIGLYASNMGKSLYSELGFQTTAIINIYVKDSSLNQEPVLDDYNFRRISGNKALIEQVCQMDRDSFWNADRSFVLQHWINSSPLLNYALVDDHGNVAAFIVSRPTLKGLFLGVVHGQPDLVQPLILHVEAVEKQKRRSAKSNDSYFTIEWLCPVVTMSSTSQLERTETLAQLSSHLGFRLTGQSTMMIRSDSALPVYDLHNTYGCGAFEFS